MSEPMLTVTYEVPLSECKRLAELMLNANPRTTWYPHEEARADAYRRWEAENQRYKTRKFNGAWEVVRNGDFYPVASFVTNHPNPKAAAEAEAARLKEQERGK